MTASKNLSELFRWFLFAGYAILLYIVCTLPAEQIPAVVIRANDKVLHFLSFFLLTLLGFRAFSRSSYEMFYQYGEGKAVCFSLFYGPFIEWAQRSVPGREMSFMDVTADSLGTLLAFLIFRFSRRFSFD